MTTIYDSLERLARHESNKDLKFARLTIERIESAFDQNKINQEQLDTLLNYLK